MKSNAGKKIIPPEVLLNGYRQGIFPMSESRDDSGVSWYSAKKRGIIPLDKFRVSSNVKRLIRNQKYHLMVNRNFRSVVESCADRESTWISDLIIDSFEVLHLAGYAHSVETYDDDLNLVGGLYGVTVGAAFFGESMFKTATEADKVALWHCHDILQANDFTLWDTQFYTEHLGRFGCIEISREEYVQRLTDALSKDAAFLSF
ncbi:MAG: leucyl/phenylalanyl-tRNA--protein transferase [Balneolaceae bacterium]|nr:MAG: leucyl/phenylalanyl-tRNA--protein transferase [Balneolaceae bacterium]